jgi:hypothetical protein
MESSPLFREVCLLIQEPEDVTFALGILSGTFSVSQVAELKGQETASFNGDGDVLILSYTRDLASASQEEAEIVLGSIGDDVITQLILPGLRSSKVALEIVVRYCNLSTRSVIAFADVIRQNRHLIGFSVLNNPGNKKRTDAQLKSACIETLAPIQWFQGEFLSNSILKARQARPQQRREDEQKSPDDVDVYAVGGHPLSVSQPEMDGWHTSSGHESRQWHKMPTSRSRASSASSTSEFENGSFGGNEREKWLVEMKERMRSTTEDEAEIDRILDNLELYELEKKLESILSVGSS